MTSKHPHNKIDQDTKSPTIIKTVSGFKPRIIEEERKSRGKAQRIFLILTHDYNEDEFKRSYEVMGTSGNAYTVCIETVPTCTCPDYATRHKRCKHIYFVLSRIMKVKSDQEDIAEYTDDDLYDMFANIPQITENLRVDASKVARFKSLKKNGNGEVTIRTINEEDVCPICLGDMYECNEDIIFCKYWCGSSIHKECFDRYNAHRNEETKCLFCHKKWEKSSSEYINLT